MRPYLNSLLAAVLSAAPLAAQSVPTTPSVYLGAGVMQYDLSGTGDAMMYTARVESPWTRLFLLDGGVVYARPHQQFGDTTSLVIVDGQIQLQYPIAIFRPYVGGGAGIFFDFRDDADGGTITELTLSGAVGVRAPLRDRLGMRAELRVRGIETNFTGSIAEWTIGLTWRP